GVVLADAHLGVELETTAEDEEHREQRGHTGQPPGQGRATTGRVGDGCRTRNGHRCHSARAGRRRRVDVPNRRPTSRATVLPLVPITPPPGWVEAPARKMPSAPGTV